MVVRDGGRGGSGTVPGGRALRVRGGSVAVVAVVVVMVPGEKKKNKQQKHGNDDGGRGAWADTVIDVHTRYLS